MKRSKEISDQISIALNGLTYQHSPISSISAAQYQIALDHHLAIIVLVDRAIPVSAFALARPLWDAWVRGFYAANCVADDKLQRIFEKDEWPKTSTIEAEVTKNLGDSPFRKIVDANKKILNSFTHGGSAAIALYPPFHRESANFHEEQCALLRFADSAAIMAAAQIGVLAKNQRLAEQFIELAATAATGPSPSAGNSGGRGCS